MNKQFSLIMALILLIAAACTPTNAPLANTQQENLPPTATPVILPTAMPVVVATNTYIPIIESETTATVTPDIEPTISPTATPEPTPTETPVPIVPVDAIQLVEVVSGLQKPLYLTHAFDDRLFVLEQIGRIRIIKDGQLIDQPFLDIRDRVGSVNLEQGLLGLAFHPDYSVEGTAGYGKFWVNYTDYSGNTQISRFSVSNENPDRADPASEVVYLTQRQPYPNHNGGILKFGPDGYLYAGLGDGGSANDPLQAGQDLSTFLGKILRLEVDTVEGAYAIPGDNPFVGTDGALPEIWAYGLRNPWRLSFDRENGNLFISDVGQNKWEEINFQPVNSAGGENYGWKIMEGNHCFQADNCDETGLVQPIFEYSHQEGCSVTGGYIYRGQAHPEMTGNYFLGDYCQGTIWRLFPQGDSWEAAVVLDTDLIITSFGEDVNGNLYVMDFNRGGILRIEPAE